MFLYERVIFYLKKLLPDKAILIFVYTYNLRVNFWNLIQDSILFLRISVDPVLYYITTGSSNNH